MYLEMDHIESKDNHVFITAMRSEANRSPDFIVFQLVDFWEWDSNLVNGMLMI